MTSTIRQSWNLQDAKAKLSELVDRAQAGNAQVILRRGKPAAAIVSIAAFEALQPKKSLVSFLLASPLVGSELDLSHAAESVDATSDSFSKDNT